MTDRGYQPDWDLDKARGEQAEALFSELRSDIASGRVEVKRDDRARDTGNFYVEYECKRRDGSHPSGIATTAAETWAIYVEPVMLAVPVETLKKMSRDAWRAGKRAECIVGSHPTRGVLIPLAELVPAAVRLHGTEHGAPTDEPPPAAPFDTDMEAAVSGPRFGDDDHPDTFTLPTEQQSHAWRTTRAYQPDPAGWTA